MLVFINLHDTRTKVLLVLNRKYDTVVSKNTSTVRALKGKSMNEALNGLGRMLTYAHVGKLAGDVSAETVRRWTKRRVKPLPTVRLGHNLIRISERHLADWLGAQVRT